MKGLFQTHNILLDIRGIEADKHIENTNTEDEESNNSPFLHLPALVWLVWSDWQVRCVTKMICQNYVLHGDSTPGRKLNINLQY